MKMGNTTNKAKKEELLEICSFKQLATLQLKPGEENIFCLAVWHDYLFAGIYSSPGRVVKIDLKTFKEVGTFTMQDNAGALVANVGALVADDNYLYASSMQESGGTIFKIDPVNLTKVAEGSGYCSNPGCGGIRSLAIGNGYLYAGMYWSNGVVIKIDPANLQKVKEKQISPANASGGVVTLTFHNPYLYAGLETAPGKVARISPNLIQCLPRQLLPGEDNVYSSVGQGNCVYFGTATNPGKIIKMRCGNLVRLGDITLAAGENEVRALAIIGDVLYAGVRNRVVRINLLTFKRVSAVTLNSGVEELAIHGNKVYAAFSGQGQVVQLGYWPPID